MPRGFIPNKSFARELAGQGEYARGLAQEAKPAAAAANRIANRVMPSQPGPGIVIEHGFEGVRITNTDHGWHLDEYGSANNPPTAPLRRGVREAGMRLTED